MRVDLIGVTESDWESLAQYPVSQYWTPGDPVRNSLNKQTYVFGEGQKKTQLMKRDDPLWNAWMGRGALYLLLIADLPGIFKDQPGTKDMRRILIPLDSHRWPSGWFSSTNTIQLEIRSSLIQIETPEVPAAK